MAIGNQVLDLWQAGLIDHGDMNRLMEEGSERWGALRLALSGGLRQGSSEQSRLSTWLVPQAGVEMGLPCRIGDYTDFYASIHHAATVGKQFRPDNPLLHNYKWVPIGYHGCASSIGVCGQSFRRPIGQTKAPDVSVPVVGPSRRLDYGLELGIFIGTPNQLGAPIFVEQAEAHVFGVALFNDWSARDIQAWEYQPLGLR